LQLVAQLFLELHVLNQELVIVALTEPARAPWLVYSEAESIRVDFLSHTIFLKLRATCRTFSWLPAFWPAPSSLSCPLPSWQPFSSPALLAGPPPSSPTDSR